MKGATHAAHRVLFSCLLLAAGLVTPATASADATVVADPAAQQITALAGRIAWVTGPRGHQNLMQRTADGAVTAVIGARAAESYRAVDLGFDRTGRLVLTYLDCPRDNPCAAFQDDLQGHRSQLTGFAPRGCSLLTAPAYWRTRSVYGLECRRDGKPDARRSGLYVKVDGHPAKRLPLPADTFKSPIEPAVVSVDLRAGRVAALIEVGTAHLALTESVTGTGLHSFLVADSEGDTGQVATGPVLGGGGAIWTLTDTQTASNGPLQATIERFANGCLASESLFSAPGANPQTDFRATGLAVDGQTLYLLVPPIGVVSHAFTPDRPCRKP